MRHIFTFFSHTYVQVSIRFSAAAITPHGNVNYRKVHPSQQKRDTGRAADWKSKKQADLEQELDFTNDKYDNQMVTKDNFSTTDCAFKETSQTNQATILNTVPMSAKSTRKCICNASCVSGSSPKHYRSICPCLALDALAW